MQTINEVGPGMVIKEREEKGLGEFKGYKVEDGKMNVRAAREKRRTGHIRGDSVDLRKIGSFEGAMNIETIDLEVVKKVREELNRIEEDHECKEREELKERLRKSRVDFKI